MSFFSRLYVQVLIGIAAGVLLGALAPEWGAAMRPLGDGFIKLIKMMIAPIVFCTIVAGIGKMADMKGVGSIGLKALIYFEVVSSAALLIGLGVGLVVRPGSGIHASVATLDPQAVKTYVAESQSLHLVDFLLNVIPTTIAQAFVAGDILQVLLVSVLFGLATLKLGQFASPLLHVIDQLGAVLFGMVGLIVRLAPIGAFGAMAFTIGRYGVATLLSLAKLMAAVYLTCLLFVIIVLGVDRCDLWLQSLEVHPLHQGRDPAGARDVLFGIGAATDDVKARIPRMRPVGRGARHPDRLLVQSRWHVDLHDDCGRVRRAGAGRAARLAAGT